MSNIIPFPDGEGESMRRLAQILSFIPVSADEAINALNFAAELVEGEPCWIIMRAAVATLGEVEFRHAYIALANATAAIPVECAVTRAIVANCACGSLQAATALVAA